MQRRKKHGFLALLAVILIFMMTVPGTVPGALAASVPEAGESSIEGVTMNPESASETEPERKPEGTDQNGTAAETTDEKETETSAQPSAPADGEETAAQGATLSSERAAVDEPSEEPETIQETVAAPAKRAPEEDVPEPDWLAGGTGSMEDLTASHKLMIVEQYIQRYEHYDLGITTNCTFDAVMDGSETIREFVCLSPGKSGYGLKGKYVDHIYEYTTPMLAKAFYYGVGPGSDVLDQIIEKTRGNRNGIEEIRLIITHVAASQVYAKLHEADPSMGTSKTAYNAGFHQTEPQVRQMVNLFGNAIQNMSVPKSYHVYTAVVDNDRLQDSGYGFFNKSVPEEAQVKLTKRTDNTEIISGNRLYSLEGAEYGVYTDEDCSEEAGTLTTDQRGETPALTLPSGKTYYVKEKTAPKGYRKDTQVHAVTLEKSDQVYTVDVSDTPVFANIPVQIEKKSRQENAKHAGTLAGTEFTICYYDGYYGAEDLPDHAIRTWVIRTAQTPAGCIAQLREEDLVSGTLYRSGDDPVLPLGTITIKETKAPTGYSNDAAFGKGAAMYVGQIRIDEQTGDAEIVDVQGERTASNAKALSFTVFDTPIPEPLEPQIGTYASDAADQDKTIAASGKVSVVDNVRYQNFTPGRRYRLEGTLMEKESGRAAVSGGAVITGQAIITAKTADGSIDVVLTFDADDLEKGAYVAFEDAYEIDEETGEERLVAVHKDLDDEAQTITRPEKPKKPRKPGKSSGSPGTGDSHDYKGLAAWIAICAAGIVVAALSRKRGTNS